MTDRKIALVTGAGRGLGLGMAHHLTRSGVAVLGTYLTSERAATEATGPDLAFCRLDVTRTDTFPEFVTVVRSTLRERFGVETFDYLVNNAGIGTYAPYAVTTPDQFDELVRINLKAPFFLTQALLPLINEGGRVLNVSTALTRGVVPGMSAYAATKGAIEVLTRYQAVELAERSIRVNTLMGGAVVTDFGGGIMRSPDVQKLAADTIAQGRIATTDDITAVVPAVLSDAFQWATGSIIDVSGGQSL
ncbi:SDR family NAD(P)-dependent oxidoreductase [Streptomyces aurantiacus]|uniref:3-oxoacyl-ACP reductase n=1 Tax=Streptomyces aurantiacus TaxID=47760 RepID=A0A7G1PCX6_9ACTN|nr:SDR family oxidoreductase [Streptomyces aurantiacus]BCL33279.1 3-oxoacyl-ACP reductase [Streptomyces aurantiacus]